MKISILGCGARGNIYGELFVKNNAEIVSVCDKDVIKLKKAKEKFNLADEYLFLSDIEFIKQGKIADLCIIATQDIQHKNHAIMAMEAGYDILLEKPIATKEKDCYTILNIAKKLNRKVFICHVLRYSPFFSVIKQKIESGNYGKISTINLTENVAYWHYAHSYVRGNWNNSNNSSPMILAKCCHDLDILSWYIGSKCLAVSSMGSLNFFKTENAPNGSAFRCLDCKLKNECAYNAEDFYITNGLKKYGANWWPINVVVANPDEKKLYNALRVGNYKYLFETQYYLCKVLEIKAELGVKIKNAYNKKDKNALNNIINLDFNELLSRLDFLIEASSFQWENDNKSFGVEVQCITLGGLKQRLIYVKKQLQKYIYSDILSIDELEQKQLPCALNFNAPREKAIGYNMETWSMIVSTAVIL